MSEQCETNGSALCGQVSVPPASCCIGCQRGSHAETQSRRGIGDGFILASAAFAPLRETDLRSRNPGRDLVVASRDSTAAATTAPRGLHVSSMRKLRYQVGRPPPRPSPQGGGRLIFAAALGSSHFSQCERCVRQSFASFTVRYCRTTVTADKVVRGQPVISAARSTYLLFLTVP